MTLKHFYALYARLAFRLSEADAYELQRVLQTSDAFPRGRPGPGGSAPATPFAAVAFIIAVMVGGPRRHALDSMFRYHELLQEGAIVAGYGDDFKPTLPDCPFTGKRAFGTAFAHVLKTPNLAERVETIRITRDWPEAVIEYREDGTVKKSRFVREYDTQRLRVISLPGAIVTQCSLGGPTVHQIAIDLAQTEDAKWTAEVR